MEMRDATGRRVAFWVAGATLVLFNSAVSAPSPLYAIYQAKLGFSATILTVIFAVYVVAVLAVVLPAGRTVRPGWPPAGDRLRDRAANGGHGAVPGR